MRRLFLRLDELLEALHEEEGPVWRRWWRFHLEHPEVYDFLVAEARRERQRGARSFSMKAIYNTARCHFGVELNDLYHCRYSRLMMAQELDLLGFFTTRRIRRA